MMGLGTRCCSKSDFLQIQIRIPSTPQFTTKFLLSYKTILCWWYNNPRQYRNHYQTFRQEILEKQPVWIHRHLANDWYTSWTFSYIVRSTSHYVDFDLSVSLFATYLTKFRIDFSQTQWKWRQMARPQVRKWAKLIHWTERFSEMLKLNLAVFSLFSKHF